MLQLTEQNISFPVNRKYIFHIAAWIIILVLPYIFMGEMRGRTNLDLYFFPFTVNLTLFYLNYLVLVPLLLLRKKIPHYIVSIVLIFAIIYFVDNLVFTLFSPFKFGHPGEVFSTFHKPDYFRSDNFRMPPPRPENMRLIFSMSVSGFFFMTSLALGVHDKWKIYERYSRELETEKQLKELELCRKEINPHFLFNTINNIYSLSITNSSDVSDSILKLSSILRYALYDTEAKEVRLKDELKIIDDYIQLQKLRLTENVQVNYKLISDETDNRIEPLIILTLLENAFKHGVDNSSSSFIDILLVIQEDTLKLCTRNRIINQIGCKKRQSGIGLKNFSDRLEMIYSGRYTYKVNTDNMIYTAYLEIEL